MRTAIKVPVVMGGGTPNIENMTLENAMLYLFNVAYWPMTEASGNAIDHKNNFDITLTGTTLTYNGTILPNSDQILAVDGGAYGIFYSTAFRDAFPWNKGSLSAVVQVPTTVLWEEAQTRYLFQFNNDGVAKNIALIKVNSGGLGAYRNSMQYSTCSGMTSPVMIGMTWDVSTGLMHHYTNGVQHVYTTDSQVTWPDNAMSSVYSKLFSEYGAVGDRFKGSLGHLGLSNRVITAAQMKSVFQKIFPTTRKLFIIGDSKSTGQNYWPGYLMNALNTASSGYWMDGPIRYCMGGYDISATNAYVQAHLAEQIETPEFILINMGTNDARPVTITPEEIFKTSYNAVIAACQAKWPGVPIFCQRIYRADSAQTIANSTIINGYIDDIVASYGTGIYDGPDDEVWAENGDAGATYLSTGHVHYSPAAHSVLAGLWLTAIQAVVTL